MNDTICAISTAPGVGGIAVVRVSGPEAITLCDNIWHGKPLSLADSHTAHLGTVLDSYGQPLDQCVATIYRGPRSFTGEDTVEFSVHGSRFVQRELLSALIHAGSRLAEAGEFTRRAFAAGNLDLAQAEAVADVISSNSRAAHRIALTQMRGGFSKRLSELRAQLVDLASLLELELDFSEEEVEFASREKLLDLARQVNAEVCRLHRSFAGGQAIKEGIPVALAGATNAGKSSLLNALLGDDRAIVSDIHGTTRDTIEETLEIGDYTFRFIDTAGLRATADAIERIGIQRTHEAINRARIVVLVVDSSSDIDSHSFHSVFSDSHTENSPYIIVALNKNDIATNNVTTEKIEALTAHYPTERLTLMHISAKTGDGIENLKEKLNEIARVDNAGSDEDLLITNVRHAEALRQAADSSERVVKSLKDGISGDFIAQDLRETIYHLSSITGDISTPEILATIFSRFCIGK